MLKLRKTEKLRSNSISFHIRVCARSSIYMKGTTESNSIATSTESTAHKIYQRSGQTSTKLRKLQSFEFCQLPTPKWSQYSTVIKKKKRSTPRLKDAQAQGAPEPPESRKDVLREKRHEKKTGKAGKEKMILKPVSFWFILQLQSEFGVLKGWSWAPYQNRPNLGTAQQKTGVVWAPRHFSGTVLRALKASILQSISSQKRLEKK